MRKHKIVFRFVIKQDLLELSEEGKRFKQSVYDLTLGHNISALSDLPIDYAVTFTGELTAEALGKMLTATNNVLKKHYKERLITPAVIHSVEVIDE